MYDRAFVLCVASFPSSRGCPNAIFLTTEQINGLSLKLRVVMPSIRALVQTSATPAIVRTVLHVCMMCVFKARQSVCWALSVFHGVGVSCTAPLPRLAYCRHAANARPHVSRCCLSPGSCAVVGPFNRCHKLPARAGMHTANTTCYC